MVLYEYQDTAAYNCACSEERRGIRCNVGGDNTCKYSCKLIGHTGGTCDQDFNCVCSGWVNIYCLSKIFEW